MNDTPKNTGLSEHGSELSEQDLNNVAGGVIGGCIPTLPIGPRKPPLEAPPPAI